jgi:SAM-dependent methyltransferase
MIRVNIGCGQTPTPGWHNYDNSMSVRIAKHPLLTYALDKCGMLKKGQIDFIHFIRLNNIRLADATKYIPVPDNSVEVLYSSHMVEHLDREEVKSFLSEARRILSTNGIIRIAVPDLRILVEHYIGDGDADSFIEKTGLGRKTARSLVERIRLLLFGDRSHKWMYDGPSMVSLLISMGFKNPRILPAGSTTISEPGELNLWEKQEQSVYIEQCLLDFWFIQNETDLPKF